MSEPQGGINVAIYCKGCFYSLKGLTVCRCPECGRGFDPDNSESFSFTPYAAKATLSGAINSLTANNVGIETPFRQIQAMARRVYELGEENHRLRKVILGTMQLLHRREVIDAAEVDGLLRDAGLLPPELNQIEDLFDPGQPVDDGDILKILAETAEPSEQTSPK